MKAIWQRLERIFNGGRGRAGGVLAAGVLLGLLPDAARASLAAPGTNFFTYTPLDYWLFNDTTNWTSAKGYSPISFTNLAFSDLGDGPALLLDSPDSPAWLNFRVVETNGTTNLSVNVGTVIFWYAPCWSGTNLGGDGPGDYARLLEAGGYTPDSSFGLWSLYVDPAGANVSFSAQTNDFSSNFCTYVTAPIAWASNYWHLVAFTYSPTNSALYLDGVLATNGPPLTNYPGPSALANGFFIGSDSNGVYQAQGMIDDLYTYSMPLDANTISSIFGYYAFDFYGNPLNFANISSAGSSPSFTGSDDLITGSGYLGSGTAVTAITSSNLWITNVTAAAAGDGTMNLSFTIQGGSNGVPYDVFANSAIGNWTNSPPWAWMGQGYHGTRYTLTGLPAAAGFLVLGTPQDLDGDGLTDAYENLVSRTSPTNGMSNLDGFPDGWEGLLGLTGNLNNPAQAAERSNYGYTAADWLNGVSGVRTGSVSTDAEGNVRSVAQ